MPYTQTEILTAVNNAKTNLGDLVYSIVTKKALGEDVKTLLLRSRVLSVGISILEGYNEFTLEEKSVIVDLINNYDELFIKKC
jgi:hypothetical protein